MMSMLAIFLCTPAWAAGYHFFRAEAVTSVHEGSDPAAGVGLSAFSDATRAWIAFGSPKEGPVVREGWIESAAIGPVIGVVPSAFSDIVDPYRNALVMPWTRIRVGGEAATRRTFSVDATEFGVLNLAAFGGHDPRRAYAGPTVGLGVNATWWRDWRDSAGDNAMTGKITGQGGLVAGVTARDSWYGQTAILGRFDLFGVHQKAASAEIATGVCLLRAGVPLGVELAGQAEVGDDNVQGRIGTDWSATGTLYWRVAPRPRTRIDELVDARLREMATVR